MSSRYRRVLPICEDTVGPTSLAVVMSGEDAGRQVLLTVVPHAPDSLPVVPLLDAARRELKLRHSAVLAFLDIELTPEKAVFVSEAMEGEPLSTLMATAAQHREPIAASIALRIVKEAVDAQRAIRKVRPGLGHGLLNPETLFIASCGEVLLRQPELRSAVLKIAGYRRHVSILPYLAPEMLRDEREDEECADVFSAGVLLWEMIAGRGLFGPLEQFRLGRSKVLTAPEAELLRQRVFREKIPSLSSVVRVGGAVSADAARLVDWMLARDPSERPQSLDELSRVLDSLPPSALASSAQVGQFVRRLLQHTFETRDQLIAQALRPAGPPSIPPRFQEPQTLPRSLSLASRLAKEVPPAEEEAPPAAVVPIFATKGAAKRDGLLATVAGILLAASLGGYYYLMARAPAQQFAVAPDAATLESDEEGSPELTGLPPKARTSEEPDSADKKEIQIDAAPGADNSPDGHANAQSSPVKMKGAPVRPPSNFDDPRTGFRPSGI